MTPPPEPSSGEKSAGHPYTERAARFERLAAQGRELLSTGENAAAVDRFAAALALFVTGCACGTAFARG